MFEQFTERARRVIFFARYEASQLGSGSIEPEHLLLAAFREDTQLKLKLPNEAREAIRHEIEMRLPKLPEPLPTSVDLPLSQSSKLALVYADEERKSLAHKSIDSGHLLLGLLRLENSAPAALLGAAWHRPRNLAECGQEINSRTARQTSVSGRARPSHRSFGSLGFPGTPQVGSARTGNRPVDGTLAHHGRAYRGIFGRIQ